jgi:hypothetical protein
MRLSTATLAFQRVRILQRMSGTKKKRWTTPSSLVVPQCSSRCLSAARSLQQPKEEEIIEAEWQEKVKALKKASSQSPSSGSPNAEFSTATSPAQVTDSTDKDNESHDYVSANTLTYTGGASMPVTTKLHIVTPQEDTPQGIWPVFRLMVRSHFLYYFNVWV